jgi:phosphatidylserine/phosphatidylglycerophosphate/cardiolipin synthase-like enzyme
MRVDRRLLGRTQPPPIRPAGAFEVLITAEEAYPVLAKLAWEAERSIWMAFRIFEPSTRIRGGEVPAETWLDLLREKLRQGVEVRIALADFDAVGAPELHETAWRSAQELGTIAGEGPIEVLPIRHEARIGRGWRYGLWLPAMMKLESQRRELNELPEAERRETFLQRPGIWSFLRLDRHGRLKWRAYRLPRLYPVTHHQKIAVFDAERAVIGGLDINERRWDTKAHERPAAETWHDVSVRVDGPVVADIARHLADGWNDNRVRMAALRREQTRHAPPGAPDLPILASPLPEPPAPSETAERGVKLVRTVSKNVRRFLRFSPVNCFAEIEQEHLRLIGAARKLIYIESQFLRSESVAEALARAAREQPGLGLLMVLPAAPEQIAFDKKAGIPERLGEHLHNECVTCVREAFGERTAIMTPARPVRSRSDGRDRTHDAEIIYVHAKTIVVDDREAIVSSANLNGRSLRWDTEAGVLCNVPEKAAALRRRLFEHWLPEGAGREFFGLGTAAVAAWRRMGDENAALPPERRRGFLVPHDETAAAEFGMDVPGVPEEAV